MTGVGGRGPAIIQDVIVTGQFKTRDDWTNSFTVTAGVVPNDTFPADLVMGKSVFHQWGVHCAGNTRLFEKETLTLASFTGRPVLEPDATLPRSYVVTESAMLVTTTPMKIKWGKETPIDDAKVRKYLEEYETRFPALFDPTKRKTEAITKLSRVQHTIDTGDHTPYRSAPRRYSPAQERAIQDFIKAHDGELITKSKSPWASPSHLVPKKLPGQHTKPNRDDETVIWRFCCDYRELNNRTKKHAHPLPNAMDQIQRAAGHRQYAFLDLKDGFWHIPIAANDREKTAFITPNGLYEWTRMPFGLTNAPATFQALMEEVLEPFRAFTPGLLDDMCIVADTDEQLHDRLLTVLARLEEYGLLLNTQKSVLFVSSGVFLGFIVSAAGVEADPAKISAIRDRPMPTTNTEVRGFVNAAGYLRYLIPKFSEKSGLLTDYCTGPKGSSVTLSPEAQKQWHAIRDSLTSIPVIKQYHWQLSCVMDVDSSQKYVGACLMQPHLSSVNKSVLHPVAYFSKKLSETQTRYSAQERELLAILMALQHWKHWVQGTEVTVISDHESLKTLRTKTEQPPRIMRFLDAIEHYGVRILYRSGKANVMADYLSRPPSDEAVEPAFLVILESSFPGEEEEGSVDNGDQRDDGDQRDTVEHPHQLNRTDLQAIFEHLQYGTDLPRFLDPVWVRKHFVTLENALKRIITYTRLPGDPPHPEGLSSRSTALLPVPEYEDLIKEARRVHTDNGHSTVGTTVRLLTCLSWHPELVLAAQQACVECPQCQLMRKPNPALPDLTPTLPPPPLTRWAIDYTAVGSFNILVMVEYATGWLETAVTPGMTFTDTVPLLDRVHATFGYPRELITDNAGCFAGTAAREYHSRPDRRTKVLPVTPGRPRGNGKVEKANDLLKSVIKREFNANPTGDMAELVRRATMICNRTIRPSGYSAHFLLFGTSPPDQPDAASASPLVAYVRDPTDAEEVEYQKELVMQHEAPLARLCANGVTASRERARALLQEKKALLRTYAPGDWVLRVRQRAHKHEPYYDGPWAIVSCHAGNVYALRSPGGVTLPSKYNGTNLFPAYSVDGHPVQSLWYASKQRLEEDRKRIAANAGLNRSH